MDEEYDPFEDVDFPVDESYADDPDTWTFEDNTNACSQNQSSAYMSAQPNKYTANSFNTSGNFTINRVPRSEPAKQRNQGQGINPLFPIINNRPNQQQSLSIGLRNSRPSNDFGPQQGSNERLLRPHSMNMFVDSSNASNESFVQRNEQRINTGQNNRDINARFNNRPQFSNSNIQNLMNIRSPASQDMSVRLAFNRMSSPNQGFAPGQQHTNASFSWKEQQLYAGPFNRNMFPECAALTDIRQHQPFQSFDAQQKERGNANCSTRLPFTTSVPGSKTSGLELQSIHGEDMLFGNDKDERVRPSASLHSSSMQIDLLEPGLCSLQRHSLQSSSFPGSAAQCRFPVRPALPFGMINQSCYGNVSNRPSCSYECVEGARDASFKIHPVGGGEQEPGFCQPGVQCPVNIMPLGARNQTPPAPSSVEQPMGVAMPPRGSIVLETLFLTGKSGCSMQNCSGFDGGVSAPRFSGEVAHISPHLTSSGPPSSDVSLFGPSGKSRDMGRPSFGKVSLLRLTPASTGSFQGVPIPGLTVSTPASSDTTMSIPLPALPGSSPASSTPFSSAPLLGIAGPIPAPIRNSFVTFVPGLFQGVPALSRPFFGIPALGLQARNSSVIGSTSLARRHGLTNALTTVGSELHNFITPATVTPTVDGSTAPDPPIAVSSTCSVSVSVSITDFPLTVSASLYSPSISIPVPSISIPISIPAASSISVLQHAVADDIRSFNAQCPAAAEVVELSDCLLKHSVNKASEDAKISDLENYTSIKEEDKGNKPDDPDERGDDPMSDISCETLNDSLGLSKDDSSSGEAAVYSNNMLPTADDISSSTGEAVELESKLPDLIEVNSSNDASNNIGSMADTFKEPSKDKTVTLFDERFTPTALSSIETKESHLASSAIVSPTLLTLDIPLPPPINNSRAPVFDVERPRTEKANAVSCSDVSSESVVREMYLGPSVEYLVDLASIDVPSPTIDALSPVGNLSSIDDTSQAADASSLGADTSQIGDNDERKEDESDGNEDNDESKAAAIRTISSWEVSGEPASIKASSTAEIQIVSREKDCMNEDDDVAVGPSSWQLLSISKEMSREEETFVRSKSEQLKTMKQRLAEELRLEDLYVKSWESSFDVTRLVAITQDKSETNVDAETLTKDASDKGRTEKTVDSVEKAKLGHSYFDNVKSDAFLKSNARVIKFKLNQSDLDSKLSSANQERQSGDIASKSGKEESNLTMNFASERPSQIAESASGKDSRHFADKPIELNVCAKKHSNDRKSDNLEKTNDGADVGNDNLVDDKSVRSEEDDLTKRLLSLSRELELIDRERKSSRDRDSSKKLDQRSKKNCKDSRRKDRHASDDDVDRNARDRRMSRTPKKKKVPTATLR